MFFAIAVAGMVVLAGPAIAGGGVHPVPASLSDSIDRSIEQRMQDARIVGLGAAIIVNRKLVWTNALEPGYRPRARPNPGGAECDDFEFTVVLSLVPEGGGTNYTALVIHKDAAGCKRHEEMGFFEGWGTALDQLVAYMRGSHL